jgi:hypothetical protein
MVNHIRTLLLNEGSSVNEPWYIDPTFHPVSLSGGALSVRKLIFPDSMSFDEKVGRVGAVMPFAMSAEMSSYRDMFDRRTTVPDDERAAGASTVRMFYDRMSDASCSFVQDVLSSPDRQLVFQHVGDANTDSVLDGLSDMSSHSFETSKQFSACLYGLLVKAEFARVRDVGRA